MLPRNSSILRVLRQSHRRHFKKSHAAPWRQTPQLLPLRGRTAEERGAALEGALHNSVQLCRRRVRCPCLLSADVDRTRLEIPRRGGVLTPPRVRRVVGVERRSGRGYLACQVEAGGGRRCASSAGQAPPSTTPRLHKSRARVSRVVGAVRLGPDRVPITGPRPQPRGWA